VRHLHDQAGEESRWRGYRTARALVRAIDGNQKQAKYRGEKASRSIRQSCHQRMNNIRHNAAKRIFCTIVAGMPGISPASKRAVTFSAYPSTAGAFLERRTITALFTTTLSRLPLCVFSRVRNSARTSAACLLFLFLAGRWNCAFSKHDIENGVAGVCRFHAARDERRRVAAVI